MALSSRDRFGGTRAGQFCGGVAVGPTTVLTAAHCLGEDVLGAPPTARQDLKVIAGRTDLPSTRGKEIAVRDTWVNPATTRHATPGTSPCSPSPRPLPAELGHRDGGCRRPGLPAGYERHGLRLGRHHGRRRLCARVCGPHACTCCPTRVCEQAYPGQCRRDVPSRQHAVRRGAGRAAGTPARGTAEGRWSPRGGWSGWCPGGAAAGGPAARASTRASRRRTHDGVGWPLLRDGAEGRGQRLRGLTRASPECLDGCERSERAATPECRSGRPINRPVPELARRGCEVSALFFGGAGRNGRQPLRLVLYLSGDLLEFRLELATVVGAEEQFSAARAGRRAGMPGRRSGRSGQRPSAGSRGSEQ